MPPTFPSQFSLRQSPSSPLEYESLHTPLKMGNSADIAYGGCTLAFAVNGAYQTIPETYHLYSMLGHFLGPTLTDRKVICTVREIRTTRTFATRQVEVSQRMQDGSRRPTLVCLVDFQVREKALLTYSKPPGGKYAGVDQAPSLEEARQALVDSGVVPKEMANVHAVLFGLLHRYFDQKAPPEGVMAQNMTGIAKHLPTTQDDLPLTSKTSADWFRAKDKLETEVQHLSALAFVMDAALSFLPLAHNHQFLDDAVACSSLDFALRVLGSEVDLNRWHFRELGTVAGGEGRTYSEARVWDERGKMVASMTQQGILRPKVVKAVL